MVLLTEAAIADHALLSLSVALIALNHVHFSALFSLFFVVILDIVNF